MHNYVIFEGGGYGEEPNPIHSLTNHTYITKNYSAYQIMIFHQILLSKSNDFTKN